MVEAPCFESSVRASSMKDDGCNRLKMASGMDCWLRNLTYTWWPPNFESVAEEQIGIEITRELKSLSFLYIDKAVDVHMSIFYWTACLIADRLVFKSFIYLNMNTLDFVWKKVSGEKKQLKIMSNILKLFVSKCREFINICLQIINWFVLKKNLENFPSNLHKNTRRNWFRAVRTC